MEEAKNRKDTVQQKLRFFNMALESIREENISTIKEIIHQNNDYSIELIKSLKEGGEYISQILDNVIFDEFGRPIHYLRAEVLDMLKRAKSGTKVKPPYDNKKWRDALTYLEDQYGVYLARFNKSGKDFFYKNDLMNIDKSFYKTLDSYFRRNNLIADEYIKKCSDGAEIEHKSLAQDLSDTALKKVNSARVWKQKQSKT